MNYETFRKEKDRIAELSEQEQKEFYINVLERETLASNTRLEAYFEYASLVFYEGDFRKAREILEPFAITYQSYEYTPAIIRCFNLMGVASQCEGEYVLSRYFYTVAMRIAQEKSEETYYAYEYNNICLTYISQGQYEKALEYANLAEQWLPQSDGKMNAFVALNKSDIYSHLNQLNKAEEEYEASIREYDGLDLLPDDTLICGVSLYHRIDNMK